MNEEFSINNLEISSITENDSEIVKYLKNEACALLVKAKPEDKHQICEFWKATIQYYISLEACNDTLHASEPIIYFKKLVNLLPYIECQIPLTEININERNFSDNTEIVLRQHNRCPYLFWNSFFKTTDENVLTYTQAYHLHVKKIFDFKNHTTDEACENLWEQPIYISKGGIITGEAIQVVFIKSTIIKDDKLLLKLPIMMPCAKVYYKDDNNVSNLIYVVDHREPALKKLQLIYSVPIIIDNNIKNRKLNLRNIYKNIEENPLKSITFKEPVEEVKGDYHCSMLKTGLWQLSCKAGVIATYKNGNVTIFHSRAKYKHIPFHYWERFTGYNLRKLKEINKSGNPTITFL